ncbi:hypothetical protein [Aeoliella sp.]|uniref:hypothetical protein n=1 Tax=Aeoliella sp. TaxID=2795800 RepID=UPI003CCBA4DA
MWQRIGHCDDWRCGERFWHAGLSEDGAKCLIAEYDDNIYSVWDIQHGDVVWTDDGTDGNSPLAALQDWMDSNGVVEIEGGPAAGRYHIFGLEYNHPRTQSTILDQELRVSVEDAMLLVQRTSTGEKVSELAFEAFSGDWAFASFSENDATIAVLEPYNVTFFGRSCET